MQAHPPTDMHPADVRAAINKKGLTLSAVALDANLPEYACRHALQGKHKRGEIAIARVLATTPEALWPSRFSKPRRAPNRFRRASSPCLRQK